MMRWRQGRIGVTAALFALSAGASTAQEAGLETLKQQCADNPTRACAFNLALRTVADEELAIERARILAAAADSLARIGDNDRAFQTLQLAERDIRATGFDFLIGPQLAELAAVWARIGDADRALAAAQNAPDRVRRQRALVDVVIALAQRGQVEDVQRIIDAIDFDGIRLDAQWQAAMRLIDAGKAGDAARLLPAIEAATAEIVGLARQLTMRARIAGLRARLGARQVATDRLGDIAEEAADQLTVPIDQARVFTAIAEGYHHLGDEEQRNQILAMAERYARRLTGGYDRDQAARLLANANARLGRPRAAVAWLKRISIFAERVKTLGDLAGLTRFEGQAALPLIDYAETLRQEALALEERFERDQALVQVARASGRLGGIAVAVAAAGAVADNDSVAEAFGYLAAALS